MKQAAYYIIIMVVFFSCKNDIEEVKPGEMKFIPYSSNYAVGTDSSIIIINRDSGKILSEIKRKQ